MDGRQQSDKGDIVATWVGPTHTQYVALLIQFAIFYKETGRLQ